MQLILVIKWPWFCTRSNYTEFSLLFACKMDIVEIHCTFWSDNIVEIAVIIVYNVLQWKLVSLLLFLCFSYKRVVTPKRAGIAVFACWTVAFIVGLTPMLGWNNLHNLQHNNGSIGPDLIVTCQFENVISMEYMVYFNFFGWVLPPLLFMFIIYSEIFYMIHKQLNKKVSSHSEPNKYYDKELKLAKSLALVLFLFAVSWLPLHIMNCITLFCPKCEKPMFLIYIAILLTHGNSAVNPIVYAFRIKKFRTAFQRIWKQYFCCKEAPPPESQLSERLDNKHYIAAAIAAPEPALEHNVWLTSQDSLTRSNDFCWLDVQSCHVLVCLFWM